jgi:hypothetical protein
MQCLAYKINNKQCSRTVPLAKYCWQHKEDMCRKEKLKIPDIQLKSDIIISDKDTDSIIHSYLDLDDLLKLLVNNKPKLDKLIAKYHTPLQNIGYYIKSGHLEVVKWCIGNGFRPSEKSMYIASKYGRVNILKYLYSIGLKPDRSCMFRALKYARFNVIAYLETLGFKVNKNSFRDLENLDTVRWLISKDILPYKTIVDEACKTGNFELVTYYHSIGIMPTKDIYNILMESGDKNLPMVQYLHQLGIQIKIDIFYKSRNYPTEILKFLQSVGA